MGAKGFQRIVKKMVRGSSIMGILVMILIFFCLFSEVSGQKRQRAVDDLFSVSFPNERKGWACGRWGIILHTADGGKTWVRQNSGVDYTLSSIYFFKDTQNGWAVGDQGTILYTEDGGKIWVKQKSPVSYALMDVCFVTPLKGWIVSEFTHILFTADGGKTWSKQFSDEDFILKAISFCDPLHGWAVGEYGYIYHTTDGGATWKKQAGYFGFSKKTMAPEGGNFLFDVIAIDPQTVWAVGIDGYVIRTVDGGKAWKEVVTGGPQTQLFGISSDKKDTIVIVGNGVVLRSDDKGRTWQLPEFKPPIIYDWIYKVRQRGNSGFVAVGRRGSIYLSSSTSWQRVVHYNINQN